jgi:hypothetical protein
VNRISQGDFVRLESREAPQDFPEDWWWEVTDTNDFGFDAIYTVGRIRIRRQGVSPRAVLDVRHRDEPPAGKVLNELAG